MKKILVFGDGYMAGHFKAHFGSRAEISGLRVQNEDELLKELEAKKPDAVLNCIGKTGRPNIDWCEDHQEETTFSNVTVPLMMAEICQKLGIHMTHIGSGCVYAGDNGGKGYSEDDPTNFSGSFYSRSKIQSEQALKAFPVLQLRLRMPLDSRPDPRNFITKITHYQKVISEPNSISVLRDFIEAADALIEKGATGIYNVVNPGAITHEEILKMYQELVDPNFHYQLFSMEELLNLTKAGRSNCVLSTAKLEAEGIHLRPVHEAVRATLKEYASML